MSNSKCARCGSLVRMKSLLGIRCMGKIWHKDCFQCSLCAQPLSRRSCRCYDGQIYCINCRDLPRRASTYEVPASPAANQIDEGWFHGELTRDEAQQQLIRNGDFLVRTSRERPGEYIINVRWNDRLFNFVCPRAEGGWMAMENHVMPTIESWISYHSGNRLPICKKTGALLLYAVEHPRWYSRLQDTDYLLPTEPPSAQTPPPASVNNARSSLIRQSTIDDIDVRCVAGNVCQQNVDVIVNSVGTHLDMSRGALSNAILSAAGQGIQNELWTVVGNSYGQPGCVYVTKGHRLNCKHVLHAVGYSTERGSGHSVQHFRTLVRNIIREAQRVRAQSIAIPPLCAGYLGYPESIVVKVLTEEVTDYIGIYANSCIRDVRFVVLHSDNSLLQAFSRALNNEVSETEAGLPTDTDDDIRRVVQRRQKEMEAAQPEIRHLNVRPPSNWVSAETGEFYERHEIKQGSPEYDRVIDNMTRNGGEMYTPLVYKIERVENIRLYQMYRMSKAQVERVNGTGVLNERLLWHGTMVDAVENICLHGFNRSFCGRNAVMYGLGVYFARDFSYSAKENYSPQDDDGLKYVIQSRVLTGQFTEGDEDMIETPDRVPGVRYDCAVDDIDDPTIFVVFLDYKMYPEYIISFFG